MKISFKMKALFCLSMLAISANAFAMDLDWSGQFRAEATMINGYAPDNYNGAATGTGGYEIAPAGSTNARFQTLFLRLRPKLIVNDNVSIKSEWWLGNPVTGFYGVDYPGTTRSDQRYYNSTFNGGSSISAQRFWAEFLTDLGTFQVGRAPHHWGLGLIHNSGDGVFDRYQTTGDTFKMISKFGNFTVIPAHTKYDFGNAAGGTCSGGTCTPTTGHPVGGATLSEYTFGLKYDNKDEDFEGGVNLIRRIARAQSESVGINGIGVGGMNITIWDIYGRKKMGKFEFGIEAPIFNGELVGIPYKAFALATELKFRPSDAWDFSIKAGKVPGQPNNPNSTTDKWSMVYFHPSYKLGLLMFNYNFGNFAGNNNPNNGNNVKSIYDNPITNANYMMFGTSFSTDKWRFSGSFVTAKADESAVAGQQFFNTWNRAYSTTAAVKEQGTSLGSEIDFGVALNWDEYTTFALDAGFLFPGDFYKFGNAASGADNDLGTIFGAVGSIAVKF